MAIVHVSNKGQITLPADMRRKIGVKVDSKVEVQVRDDEIIIKPVRSVREVYGIFREYAHDKPMDWDTIITETERLVAEEVVNEDK